MNWKSLIPVVVVAAIIGGLYAILSYREGVAYAAGEASAQAKWDKKNQEWNAYVIHERARWEEQAQRDEEGWRVMREGDQRDIARLRSLSDGRTCLSNDALRVLRDIGTERQGLPSLPARASSGVSDAESRVATNQDVSETIGEYRSLYAQVKKKCDGLIDWSIKNLVIPNQRKD